MNLDDVTIIIPTQNRHFLLKRAIDYYSYFNCNLIICDSSDKKEIDSLNCNNANYLHFENISFAEKLYKSLQHVKTKYVCLSADDDFLSKKGLCEGVVFLKNNRDYYSVQGKYLQFYSNKNNYSTVNLYDEAGLIHFDSNSPYQRTADASKSGMHLIYALHITENLLNSFNVSKECIPITMVEYTSNLVPVFYGKHKMLNIFWMARDPQRYNTVFQNTKISLNTTVSPLDLINYFHTPNGIEYKNKLLLKYIEVTNSSIDDAEKLFYEVFFINYIQNHIKKRSGKKEITVFRKIKNILNRYLFSLFHLFNRIFNNKTKFIFPFEENEDEWFFIKSILMKHSIQLKKFEI